MRYHNQNHYVGRSAREATGLDKLAESNRQQTIFKVSSVTDEYNHILKMYVQKTASEVNECLLEKKSSSASFDLVSQATGLVAQKLGIDPQNSQSLVSNLLRKVSKIQELYGGDEDVILRRLVDELQNTSTEMRTDSVGEAQMTMGSAFKYQKVEDQVRFEVMKQFGMTNNEAERITKSILSESRDLLISLRPADVRSIAFGIIQLIQHMDDVTIVYGIRNNPEMIKQLRNIIVPRG
jgi:hypothetical protein